MLAVLAAQLQPGAGTEEDPYAQAKADVRAAGQDFQQLLFQKIQDKQAKNRGHPWEDHDKSGTIELEEAKE